MTNSKPNNACICDLLQFSKDNRIVVETASVVKVRYLAIKGNLPMGWLTASTKYRVSIQVMLIAETASGWESPVTFTFKLPDGTATTVDQVLGNLPRNQQVLVSFGEFTSPSFIGPDKILKFRISETTVINAKKGLVFGPVMFQPN